VKLIVRRGDDVLGEREVDLTAPGRSEVLVTVPRKRAELLFVTKDNAGELDPLQLSAQARRHLDRYLGSGYQIVIPNRKVKIDGADVVAYYAHEVATGEIIGVTEEGLHGSAAAYRRALASLARDLADNGNNPVPFAHVHMMRGAIIAWWVYSKERVGGAEHEEAINKMLGEMDDWEKSTNLLAGFEGIPGARAGMGNLMGRAGWDQEGSGAAAAFKMENAQVVLCVRETGIRRPSVPMHRLAEVFIDATTSRVHSPQVVHPSWLALLCNDSIEPHGLCLVLAHAVSRSPGCRSRSFPLSEARPARAASSLLNMANLVWMDAKLRR